MRDDGNDEIIEDFLVESAENLDQLDRDLIALERDPGSCAQLGSIFRAVHTIKGTTGFLGFGRLEHLAHMAESLLSQVRDGALSLDEPRITALLDASDAIRGLLALIETTGHDQDDRDLSELLGRLAGLQTAGPPDPAAEGAAPASPAGSKVHGAPAAVGPTARDGAQTVADWSVRVDVDRLDCLMRQVGELVLARNQVVARADTAPDPTLRQMVQRLSLIVTDLHEGVLRARMQPVGHLWAKVPRLVRDLAGQFGKQIDVILQGGETQLDRSVMEAVKDPLTHLVRNAADHGFESPEMRTAAGKPVAGSLMLRASHEGGQVVLEISDDGGGIDPDAVGAKAVQRGLIRPDRLAGMSATEIIDLVFHPGFSTAERVTNVSGRGVGMDVVRTNIEKIGGTVDLQSVPGHGTTIRLTIPVTVTIIPALVVGCGAGRYAIPQATVQEVVRLEGDTVRTAIERIDPGARFRLRGRGLPLVRLAETLDLDTQPLEDRAAVDIAVVRVDGEMVGVVVDAIYETEEIVVKPLGTWLHQLAVYAGVTVLGDGDVALILDVSGLAHAD